ncbi:MAG: OsmC family protein [Polyangiaceae bacterium]|nr:OsmC family protein [Polyangiaceae bacterium]
MTTVNRFSIKIEQISGFEFAVRFDKVGHAAVRIDEPEPLGRDTAPNAARYLAAAIGNCLVASLLFCLKKSNAPASTISATVDMDIVRNEQKRLRIGKVDVTIHTSLPDNHPVLLACRETFEDFCMVTQSVRAGIDVSVRVETLPAAP